MTRNILGTTKYGPVPVVSEDQSLLCPDIEVSSPSNVASTALIRFSCGVTQRARQSSEFESEIEGTDTVVRNGGSEVAHAQPEDPDLCIGIPITFHSEIRPPPPSDRLCPGWVSQLVLGNNFE